MRRWQFDLAFVVALVLLIVVTVMPYLGSVVEPSPLVVSGLGVLLGFVFSRKDQLTRSRKRAGDDDAEG